jgi:predicted metal-dependent phosphoesterase TrpH
MLIKNCLHNLPQPKNEYDFDLPELDEFKAREQALREITLVEDSSDLKNIIEQREHVEKIKNLMKRSQSVRMCLPRPEKLNEEHYKKL